MTITMNIPDRLYQYLQQQHTTVEVKLDDVLSQAITDVLEKQFEQRINAAPIISHDEFINMIRQANAHQEPSSDDAL